MRPIAAFCSFAIACSGSDGGLVVRTVSEYGGTPIAGVKVQVGDQPWMTTGTNGEARFGKAAGPYTVRVYQAMKWTDRGVAKQRDKVWQLIEQTSNPLVVEVDGSLAQSYKARLSGTVAGRSGAAGTQVLVLGWPVAPDGTFGDSNGPTIWWEGGPSYDFTLRAVESDTQEPPSHYIGYAASRVRATDTTGLFGPGGSLSGVSLQLGPVAESSVTGQVTRAEPFSLGTLQSAVWLRFSQYDSFGVGHGVATGQPAAFHYAVPIIAGGEPFLGFFAGASPSNFVFEAFGWHHRKVALPSTGLTFDVPAPVSLTDPPGGATFGPATRFRWSAGPPGGKYSLDLDCDGWNEGALNRGIHYRGVETFSTEVSLPAIPDVAVPAGTNCSWSVYWVAPSDPAAESRGSRSAASAVTAQ